MPHTHTHTYNLFTALWILSGTTRVSQYQETFTHSHLSWSSIIPICFLHLLRSMASSLFNPQALQSFSTISIQVFFGLAPSTSCSIHFFTTDNMIKKIVEVQLCGFQVMRAVRQTDRQMHRQTDILYHNTVQAYWGKVITLPGSIQLAPCMLLESVLVDTNRTPGVRRYDTAFTTLA